MTTRPKTLWEVAVRSDSLADFGRHLRDWLHELRRFSSRAQVAAAIETEPPALAAKFSKGRIADAWLAAYAEHISRRLGRIAPEWHSVPAAFHRIPFLTRKPNRPHSARWRFCTLRRPSNGATSSNLRSICRCAFAPGVRPSHSTKKEKPTRSGSGASGVPG